MLYFCHSSLWEKKKPKTLHPFAPPQLPNTTVCFMDLQASVTLWNILQLHFLTEKKECNCHIQVPNSQETQHSLWD